MKKNWDIRFSNKCVKQIKKFPLPLKPTLLLLIRDLELNGPSTGGSWKNYGKLKDCNVDKRHCHLFKGRPTYVCCWQVINKQVKIMEMYYVGTHEKAPY